MAGLYCTIMPVFRSGGFHIIMVFKLLQCRKDSGCCVNLGQRGMCFLFHMYLAAEVAFSQPVRVDDRNNEMC